MSAATNATEPIVTRRIRMYGIVQGVGFRPTVDRHATATRIAGTVCNKGPYVEIYAQGTQEQIDCFVELMHARPPKRASIIKMDVKPVEDAPVYQGFSIVESERTRGEIFISPDLAICEDCKRELYDPHDRRYLHPFINCTNCGPRMTILDALPYDRERTSMKMFPMCPTCAHEYHDPASRRYDAQPVCCNDCGPQVYLLDRLERGRAAITEARRILKSGGTVAIKGIGGFHLACDATSPAAVELLRERKRRSAKPFAVMARDLETVERECAVTPAAEELLTGHQKPILLLHKLPGGRICEAVAPENPKLGVMLPYAPLQMLLFDYDDGITNMPDCLVMTSANESGAPICRDDDDARAELGPLCDAILSHDRIIRMRADDTVLDLFEERPYMVRRSRGWAPLPFVISGGLGTRVLAVGGELKNSFCLGSGELVYPSPYVGDLSDVRTVRACEDAIDRFETLLEFEPEVVACDLHPRYNATMVAESLAAERNLPLVRVQHHYAHVASCMAENDFANPVIGISFDGTGYGTDGTIWGGEVLLSDYHGFERVGHIAPFAQVGGDLSAREGWRCAVSMLRGCCESDAEAAERAEALGLCTAAEARLVLTMAARGVNTVASTSCGRLFDAVSAVLGIRRASTYEGEAATQLQFAIQRCPVELRKQADADAAVLHEGGADGAFVLPTDELFARIVADRESGEDVGHLAWSFHAELAALVVAACERVRAERGVATVALTGGCYQNTLLLALTVSALRERGFTVLTHSLVPPNDGGIALGQAVVAAQWMRDHAAPAQDQQQEHSK